MQPTSKTQYEWTAGNPLPKTELAREGLWSVSMGMPDGHIHYSLCYLIIDETGGVHVIDPGWGSDENWARLEVALTQIGKTFDDVTSIVCTHFHPDHMGMAERLREASGAPIAIHAMEARALEAMQSASTLTVVKVEDLERWGVPDHERTDLLALAQAPSGMPAAVVNYPLEDNVFLDIPGWNLGVIHTAGHTSGHICLREADRKLLFTGDHVLPTIYAGIGLGAPTVSNPMADYLDGLDMVRVFDDHEVLPGHGYRFTGIADRCDVIEFHHLRRSREVAATLAQNPAATIWQTCEQVTWTAGWGNLKNFYRLSALRQISMHVEFVQSAAGRRRLATT